MRYPLIAPLAAFASGIVAAQYAKFSFLELSTSTLLLLGLALLGLFTGALRAGLGACLTGFAFAGALLASLPPPADPDRIDTVIARERMDLQDPVRIQGWVRIPPTVRSDRDQFVLTAESIGAGVPARGGVRIAVIRRPGEAPVELHYGDRIRFFSRLRGLRNFENPGGFDRVSFLLRQDIQMTGTVRAGVPIERLPDRGGSRLLALIWRGREWAERRLDRLLGADTANCGVVKAMVLGDEAYLDRPLGVSFQKTGTYHALVVAGLHVGALAWFFLFLFRVLGIPRGWGSLATIGLLIAFVLLCGSRLPTVRAASMAGAYLAAQAFYRQRRARNVIAGTAFALLLFDPAGLFDVSFQLSFLSVGVIAALAMPILAQTLEPYRLALPDLPNRDRDIHLPPKAAQTRIEWRMAAARLPLPPRLAMAVVCKVVAALVGIGELIVVSASIQVGLALPMAVYFHRISWSGISANLFVVPLIGLIVPLGFVAIVTGWTCMGQALAALVSAMIAIVGWHARWTWLEARVPAPPSWFACIAAAALIAFACVAGRKWTAQLIAGLVLLGAVAGLAVHPFAPRLDRGKFEITALDVGQGDALFLALPQGQAMLVDGGGIAAFGNPGSRMPDIGEEVVSPYLWSRSIRALEVIAVSHAHYDHIGGLPALLENFRVRELWIGTNPPSAEFDRLLEIAARRNVRLVHLSQGEVRRVGGVSFELLSPPLDYMPRNKPSNDDSMVLLARYGERSFLLTGDIEQKSERRLAADGLLGHADVLKAPHHGSKTSSSDSFLARVTPWFAIVSAGADNPYGHPHRDVLSRFAGRRIGVFRTDQHGSITMATDGRRLSVSTHRWDGR
jgi:competence protein ComEC